MKDCCKTTKKNKKCFRKSDKKIFSLPRRFSRKKCNSSKIKGFTMRSSCAPFKDCKKTQKGGNQHTHSAVAVFHQNKNNVSGTVHFAKVSSGIEIKYNIKGLKDGNHGFHVHQWGDLTDNCDSACSHFNPSNHTHGDRNSEHRHVGDLGNVYSKNNEAIGTFIDNQISLDLQNKNCIIGRSVIVHEKEYDLGKGSNPESLKTGNAGARLACGVIGLTQNKC